MGNRRLGNKRLEAVLDNMLSNAGLNGLNGSPFSLKDPDRVYLEEYFKRLPDLHAVVEGKALADADATAVANRTIRQHELLANKDFELLGTNHSRDDVTFHTTAAGILLTPDGTNGDALIVLPHLQAGQTAWTSTLWGTENQVQWECLIRTDESNIDDQTVWAGLKLTNTEAYATDADQVYFLYADEDDDSGALTTNANLHCVVSIGGTDHITDLGITVAAATNYRLGITIDSDRKAAAWVNGVQYGLTQATTAGGDSGTPATQKSLALTDNVDLIPYVGIKLQAGNARTLALAYQKMSRIIFE